jgi:hypothetical protein
VWLRKCTSHNLNQVPRQKSKLPKRAHEENYRVSWERAGILETGNNSRNRKYNESANIVRLTYPISQNILESLSRLSVTRRENQYNGTDSS